MSRGVLVVLAAVAIPGGAYADPILDRALASPETRAVTAEWHRPGEPQALAQAVVRTQLLALLNELGESPWEAGGPLDPARLAWVGRLKSAGRRYAFAYDDAGLTAALVRIPVPVDGSLEPSDPRRLARLRGALAELAPFGLRPADPDGYGNVFLWRGRAGEGRVLARYRPREDAIYVVYARGRRRASAG